MATYEGLWRCGACGRVNLGRHDSYPGCGFHTNDETEFFLPQSEAEIDALIVEDEKLLRMAADGPNWFCGHCGNQNRAPLPSCASCGNPRSVIPGSIEKARDGDGSFQEEVRNDHSDWAEGRPPSPPAAPQYFAAPRRIAGTPNRGILWLIFSVFGGGALLVFLCVLSTLFTGPSTANLKMTALEWKRTVYVEEYRLEDHEDWDDQVPGDAKIISKKRSVRSYNQVPVGTRTVQESYTENVRDGTESYTERVSDGTERYKCGVINKKNGFFFR